MLNLWGKRQRSDCEGTSRRDFLKLGALGLTGLSLSGLLRQRAAAAAAGKAVKDTSVVWLWLSGGASQIETFDPKMDAPAEYRSMVGAVETSVPGVQIGGLFPRIAQRAHRMALVRSFAHSNSGHLGATHYVMTGWENPLAVPDSGAWTIARLATAISPLSLARTLSFAFCPRCMVMESATAVGAGKILSNPAVPLAVTWAGVSA